MFKFTNPHPQGKRVGDCIKRAYVIASEINYHDIQIMLNRWKKITNDRKYWKSFIEKVLLGLKIDKDMKHAYCDHRYTVESFARTHDLVHILRCSKHLVACRYGNYYDTWNSGGKSVYIAWLIARYDAIVNNIKENYPQLCKGLSLERIRL